MKPYYEDKLVKLYNCKAVEYIDYAKHRVDGAVTVTDPPFNVNYHYNEYEDNLKDIEYLAMLGRNVILPCVLIHYPETTFRFAQYISKCPTRCVAWVYPSNTRRQWRMVSWFGCKPDFSLVKGQYKNPTDKRVKGLIDKGKAPNLYDWWEINQVKNVSKEKTKHPCQMPLEIMKNIVGITPAKVIYDPFAGSGTTLVAAKMLGRQAIGVELSEEYAEICAKRLSVVS